jgi:hypothetical protein
VGRRLLRWAIWLAAMSLLGVAGPARAQPATGLAQPYSPSPFLPDPGTFDSLVMDLAHAPSAGSDGFRSSSASLAFGAGAPSFAPAVTSRDLGLIQSPALNAPLGEVPAGRLVFNLLVPSAPGGDPKNTKVRDLGQLMLGPNSMVQRTGRALFGDGVAHQLIGAAVMGGVVTGLGTGQASQFGLSPGTQFKLLGGALNQSVSFHCGPSLQNPGFDLATRYHALHVTSPRLTPWVRDLYFEGGLSVQRDTGNGVVPNRYLRMHLQSTVADLALGWTEPPGAPGIFSLSFSGTAGPLRLHGAVSRQSQTGLLTASGAVTSLRGKVQTGLFAGGQSGHGITAGVLAMTVF